MDVILDRPSVHAGDDTTSHEIRLTVPDDATVGAVLEAADLDAFLRHGNLSMWSRPCG